MVEEEPGSRRIEVTITSKGEGRMVFYNDGETLLHPPAVPDNMSGSEAVARAKKLQKVIVGYDLKIIDHSQVN